MSPPIPLFGLDSWSAFWELVGLAQDSLPSGNLLLSIIIFMAFAVARGFPADHSPAGSLGS